MISKHNNKRILFFLATEKGYQVFSRLINDGRKDYIAGVVSFHEVGVQKDYFSDLKNVCMNQGICFFEWKTIKDNLISLIHDKSITSCVAISWRYLLPLSINEYLEDDLIIFHDSLLPKYRGFAPLVTAMINGDKNVGASVLYATEQADCGEIIMQEAFEIDETENIQNAIEKMSKIYAELACKLVDGIIGNTLVSSPQVETNATYSIWRDEDDYWIDWKWSAEKIQRFVKAVGYPYKGAKTMVGENTIRILEASIIDDIDFAIRMPGKIWMIDKGIPTIVCGKGMIRIDKAIDENGCIHMFTRLRDRMVGGV